MNFFVLDICPTTHFVLENLLRYSHHLKCLISLIQWNRSAGRFISNIYSLKNVIVVTCGTCNIWFPYENLGEC